ncbi:hypothetical protein Tco_0598472 [Tanacetum coccineum]
MTKLSMESEKTVPNQQVQKCQSQSQYGCINVNQEPVTENTMDAIPDPFDGTGKPNSINYEAVKTKWALNQFQQPICVQLTKTVKTLKAQS